MEAVSIVEGIVDTILWRRLDVPGHDVCRLAQGDRAWRLEGVAVFQHEGVPACLGYEVECDDEWRTREGVVHGWVGARTIDVRIARTSDGVWTINEKVAPQVAGCIDLDFGFTPATNLIQLRRTTLQVGEAADVPVAWLDVDADVVQPLHQRYERRSGDLYWYEAPRFDYSALLRVNAVGFVTKYPKLWEAET
jgi:hypothetical protein